jgi:FlaA1/EpsC-like NDP-sugar epimerase
MMGAAVVTGRRVMVTGAGGSIGSELVRQIAAMQPAHLTLVELSELNLYAINCNLVDAGVTFQVEPLIADVRHTYAMERLFAAEQPDLVLHAAALKHVPLLENDHNLIEAVRTNVGGTATIAQLCSDWRAQMVLISTDKAVNPSSVMGLTKRVGELAALAQTYLNRNLALSIVRFGNVVGSSGSFVPLFERQIAQGGPVTVTHPEMRRFLMSIQQAVALVLNVAQDCKRNAAPKLYVLDMGEPVSILDVARRMIAEARSEVEIVITGIRPGEKLEEELFYEDEKLQAHVLPGVSGCFMPTPPRSFMPEIHRLCQAAAYRDLKAVKKLLVELEPSYSGREVWK